MYFSVYTFSNSQMSDLLNTIQKAHQISMWEIISTLATTIGVLISLFTICRILYKSAKFSWLKIHSATINLIFRDTNPRYPSGIALHVIITRQKDIPLNITNAYIFLFSKKEKNFYLGIGFKSSYLNNSIIHGDMFFNLMRTMGSDKKPLREVISIDEIYNTHLKHTSIDSIEYGEIAIHTNAGVYSKKLTKKEIANIKSVFQEVKNLVEKNNDPN